MLILILILTVTIILIILIVTVTIIITIIIIIVIIILSIIKLNNIATIWKAMIIPNLYRGLSMTASPFITWLDDFEWP